MEEHWIEQIRNRFENREIAPPDDLWNDISNIMANKPVNNTNKSHDKGNVNRSKTLLWKALSVAASVAVVVGVFIWHSKQAAPVYVSNNVNKINSRNNADLNNKIKDIINDVTEPANVPMGAIAKFVATKYSDVDDEKRENADLPVVITDNNPDAKPQEKIDKQDKVKENNGNKTSDKAVGNRKRQNYGGLLLANNDNIRRGNTMTIGVNMSGIAAMGNSASLASSAGQLGVMSDPINGNMPGTALLSGVNNMRDEATLNVKTKYHTPIKVGMSVGIGLTKNITLITGVNYSYLSSENTVGNTSAGFKEEQSLHYIGVPIAVSYKIWSTGRLSVYATGGAEAAFCVSGKKETTHYTGSSVASYSKDDCKDNKPQFSVNAIAGVQYDVSKHLGAFIEPGIGYYFNNGSSVNNIYKDKPFNVNLNVGFRLNVNK